MKKPNFFIIGAPKCGTTSLAAWLTLHPNVYVSPVKEPCFFNRDGLYRIGSLPKYEALFAKAGPEHVAVGEASTHYLYSREAVPRILEHNPDARFIVSIRNPIEMVQALHAERVWQGEETVKKFEDAWRLQEARQRGKYIPKTVHKDPERLQYGSYCRLGEQLTRLYAHVSKDRVLVLVLDDIAENPKREYQKVLNFLGIPDDGRDEFPVLNPRKAARSAYLSYVTLRLGDIKRALGITRPLGIARWISAVNTRQPRAGRLPDDLRAELHSYFAGDIHLLEQLLQRDFSRWLA